MGELGVILRLSTPDSVSCHCALHPLDVLSLITVKGMSVISIVSFLVVVVDFLTRMNFFF